MIGAKNVTTSGVFKVGTGTFDFADVRVPGRFNVGGQLVIDGSVSVAPGNWWLVHPYGRVEIGDRTYFNANGILYASIEVKIGRRCAISWGVTIMDEDFHQVSVDGKPSVKAAPVSIGDDVLVCAGARILRGAKIADGCVVAAGAIVTGEFLEPRCMLAGVPAKVVRRNVDWR